MREADVSTLYISQAQKLEQSGRLKEAEKLYIMVRLDSNPLLFRSRFRDQILG